MVLTPKEIDKTLNDLQVMSYNVQILYDKVAKRNHELSNLANMSYYFLWNYSKSLILTKLLLVDYPQSMQDFAKGQLYVTINESIKQIIGFGKQRQKSLWINEMSKYCSMRSEIKEQYNKIKDAWIEYTNENEKNKNIKTIRDIATHGDKSIEKLTKIKSLSLPDVIKTLDWWGKIMWTTAHFTFTCFENECQQAI